jgi:Domain of unknown function (DUF4157)
VSEGGKTSKPSASPSATPTPATESAAIPTVFRSVDPSQAIGPARFDGIRAERQEAAAQIQRSLKAWRSAKGAAGTASVPTGAGAPLSTAIRSRMEPNLGASLGNVRVHTGADSAEAAKGFGARAFTIGEDVHFNSGEFTPGTKEGDRLLAHELTHVVQGQKSGVQRKAEGGEEEKGAEVSQPGEPAEKEADAVGDEVADKLHGDEKGGDKKKDGQDKKDGKAKKGGKDEKDGKDKKGDHGDEQAAEGGEHKEGKEAKGAEHEGEKKGDGAGAGEKAPAIGAKLEGVGRKIFLTGPTGGGGAGAGKPFTPEEEAMLKGMVGGPDLLAKIGSVAPDKRDSLVQEAKVAIQEAIGGGCNVMIGHVITKPGTTKALTEIDVETDSTLIQVKGGDYKGKRKLSDDDMNQLTNTKRYNEKMRLDASGKKLPPKKIVYQFTQPIDKELGDWLKSKGVSEVRVGKL